VNNHRRDQSVFALIGSAIEATERADFVEL
jgi:hypothetical protein